MSAFISFFFIAAMTPWRAFVFMKLWFWYLVPIWPVLAAPKWNLYGVMLIAGLMTASNIKRDTKKRTREDHIFYSVAAFIVPAMMLLIGWTIKAICL